MEEPAAIDGLLLEEIDADGSIAETFAAVCGGSTRAGFLRGLVVGSGAVLATLGAPFTADAALSGGDTAILRFDLALEYLQAGLYTEAEQLHQFRGRTEEWVRVVGAHERAHVVALQHLLGPASIKSPRFDFRGVTEDVDRFTKTAIAFEDLTAALLKYQAPRLRSQRVLVAALGLHSVEARHASWIRHVAGIKPTLGAFDEPQSQRRMAALVKSTHFIVTAARTRGRSRPGYTG
jgi:hypothetical protein